MHGQKIKSKVQVSEMTDQIKLHHFGLHVHNHLLLKVNDFSCRYVTVTILY